ncbi:PLA2G15 [Cordylochernes scorpioides]|uniref:PLA2G15 n=1 Tax=Cordylochernes scorpioides TaxID=51811 RepID=A0ABY6KCX5_9ARAC|nr:PLA2G15 [Cordylochernes scorpioides]
MRIQVTLENGTCPDEMEKLFHNMQNLVEKTVKSKNEKVVVVCHSLGCSVFLTLLGPGIDFGQSIIQPKIVRELFRTLPSFYYLMPFGKLWDTPEVLVQTDKKNYTSKDLLELLVDLQPNGSNFPNMLLDAMITRKKLGVPGVKTVCFYGTGSQTPARLVYRGPEGLNGTQEVIYGDGDGTVNTRNIEVCRGWMGRQKQPVFIREVRGVTHRAMVSDSNIIDAIYSFASGPQAAAPTAPRLAMLKPARKH